MIDCAIIGAGPAGLSAAIQAKREGLSVEIFEKDKPGGQARVANLIENFPGFPGGITGPEFVERIINQALSHEVTPRIEVVQSVTLSSDTFFIRSGNGETKARTIIIASGLKPKRLGICGEMELAGKSIFYYADPATIQCRGKEVLIIGSGEAALDQAINFSKYAKGVTIAMKHASPRSIPILIERVKKMGIAILPLHIAIEARGALNKVKIDFQNSRTILADIINVCIGKETDFGFVNNELLNSGAGGLFFAGDCVRKHSRHCVIACGDGVRAVIDAVNHLKNKNENHFDNW